MIIFKHQILKDQHHLNKQEDLLDFKTEEVITNLSVNEISLFYSSFTKLKYFDADLLLYLAT